MHTHKQWLALPVGDTAKTDEYNIKLGEMKGALDRAIQLTAIKRQVAYIIQGSFG